MVSWILPKNQRRSLSWVLISNQDSELRSFFGRIQDAKICFWDLLTFNRLLDISNLAWKQHTFSVHFGSLHLHLSLLDKILLFLLCSFLPSTGVLRALIRHCIDINTSGPTYLGTFAHMNLVQKRHKKVCLQSQNHFEKPSNLKKTLLRDDTFFINTRKNMKKNTNVCFDVMYLADLIQQPIPKLNFSKEFFNLSDSFSLERTNNKSIKPDW